jgi:hypothetical protein
MKTTKNKNNGSIPQKGEAQIKAEVILNAFQGYRRQSWLYRLLEWFGLR